MYIDRAERVPALVAVTQPDLVNSDQLTDAVYVALLEDPGYPDPPVVQATVLGEGGAEVIARSEPVDRSPVELVAYAEDNVVVLNSARFT